MEDDLFQNRPTFAVVNLHHSKMKENEDPNHNIGDLSPSAKARLFDLHQETLKKEAESHRVQSSHANGTFNSNNIEIPLKIAGSQPLSSVRDPRRRPLLGRTPFAPVAEPHVQNSNHVQRPSKREDFNQNTETSKRGSNVTKNLFGKNDITPAYAYKNAESGLLEIRSIVPPHPESIDAEEGTFQEKDNSDSLQTLEDTVIPALYPIALNGGGIGIYQDPRDFASGRMGAFSHNQRDPARITSRSFISFPWNLGDGTYSDHKRKKRTEGESQAAANRFAKVENVDEETGRLSSHEVSPTEKNESDQDFSPWRVWERVHNYMVDVAERTHQIPKKLHFQDIENTRTGKSIPFISASSRRKRIRLSTLYNEDDYDFVLVLKPKMVYKFWADLLDFRAEYGLENSDDDDDDSHDMENDDHFVAHKNTATTPSKTLIDANPYPSLNIESTPLSGTKKRRRGEVSSEKNTKSASPSRRLQFGSDSHRNNDRSSSDGKFRFAPRQSSLFEKALEAISPPKASVSLGYGNLKNMDKNYPTDERLSNASISRESSLGHNKSYLSTNGKNSTAIRRKWGGRLSYTNPSPSVHRPLHSVPEVNVSERKVSSTYLKGQTLAKARERKKQGKKRLNTLRIEDIPRQVVPRGIAARSHGMEEFLSALKIGIVVRRHRPKVQSSFVKLSSNDGGDTIQISYVSPEDAVIALKEQRIRFNKSYDSNRSRSSSSSAGWSDAFSSSDSAKDTKEIQSVSVPDYIAAEKYRGSMSKVGISQMLMEAALKAANAGLIKASEIVAVHPATHSDPFSADGLLGTSTLRDSASQYKETNTFTLILPTINFSLPNTRTSLKQISEKWYSGSGSEKSFRYLDLEAATEGEYWSIFRGFLLLHRDATYGRFASQRASGFSSKYSKLELEQMSMVFKPDGVDPPAQHDEPKEEPMLLRFLKRCSRSSCTTEDLDSKRPSPPPSDYFLGFKSTGTQIWSRLRLAGLETQRIYALDSTKVMIKIRCPPDRLMDVAEVLRFKLKTIDGYYAPFREGMVNMFLPSDDCKIRFPAASVGSSLFKSSDRQRIIDFIIRSRIRDTGAELGQRTDLGKDIAVRLPLHMHSSLEALYDIWVFFYRQGNWESLMKESCDYENNPDKIHTPPLIYRFVAGGFLQPLDSIEKYFGERVAFYFAWLQHISLHLIIPSIVGAVIFSLQVHKGTVDIPIRPYFATFMMLWSFYVMVSWKQRQNYLAHRWGSLNYKEEETTRPQHYGEYRKCEITGEWTVHYPSWKRWFKYSISVPMTFLSTCGFSLAILILYANRDIYLARYFGDQKIETPNLSFDWSWHSIVKTKSIDAVNLTTDVVGDPHFWYINAGFPVLMGFLLPIFNFFLFRISITLNDFENHRTESQYRNALIIKIFASRFVAYFAALYYYTSLSIGRDKQGIERGLLRVATSLFVYLTVSQWWNIFLIIYVPLLYHRWRLHNDRMKLRGEIRELEALEMDDSMIVNATVTANKERRKKLQNKRLLLEQAKNVLWEELMLPQYDPFFDYVQTVMHFAYAACFSSVLPIAPMMILINNLIGMRLNAFKICRGRSRPLSVKTGGIGVWEHVLHIVTVVGVLTNCYLTAWTDSQFLSMVKKHKNSDTRLFIITIVWEHVMLLLKYILQSSFSKYPKTVSEDIQREAHEKLKWRSQSMRVRNGRRSGSYPLPPSRLNDTKSGRMDEKFSRNSNSGACSWSSDDNDEEDVRTVGDRSEFVTLKSQSSTLRRRSS